MSSSAPITCIHSATLNMTGCFSSALKPTDTVTTHCRKVLSLLSRCSNSYLMCCISNAYFYLLSHSVFTDLPTCRYLTVLVRKSVGSTDVCPYFSKYRHRVSRKYGNWDMNKCKLVASEVGRRELMGSYRSLTFAYFKPFPGLRSNKFVKPVNIDFASKLYGSLPSSYYGGFELETVGDK